MIALASVLLLVTGGYVLWPLLMPAPARPSPPGSPRDADQDRRREREELELDVASGRLSHQEADDRRREARDGAVVVCDRFVDSTVAYQGHGLGLDPDRIRSLSAYASGGLMPDLTILLDLPPAVGFARRAEARRDRIEQREDGFHRRLRDGFLEEARREPGRIRVIDGSALPDAVEEAMWVFVAELLERTG